MKGLIMQYNKATRFVQYVDNFLDEKTFRKTQALFQRHLKKQKL